MKSRRHAKILDIISEHSIETQDELLTKLREDGFQATQATISRDIKDLRLVKTLAATASTVMCHVLKILPIFVQTFSAFCLVGKFR